MSIIQVIDEIYNISSFDNDNNKIVQLLEYLINNEYIYKNVSLKQILIYIWTNIDTENKFLLVNEMIDLGTDICSHGFLINLVQYASIVNPDYEFITMKDIYKKKENII